MFPNQRIEDVLSIQKRRRIAAVINKNCLGHQTFNDLLRLLPVYVIQKCNAYALAQLMELLYFKGVH